MITVPRKSPEWSAMITNLFSYFSKVLLSAADLLMPFSLKKVQAIFIQINLS